MGKLGKHRSAWKIQRALLTELPGLGKPGALERRPYPPGQHGMARRKFSEYATRLKEKQKILFHYGMREEQLRRFVKTAKYSKNADWMQTLIGMLEMRVDNVIFRLGFAASIAAARQMVRHGHVLVNGKKLDIPSALLNRGDIISPTQKAYQGTAFQTSIAQPRLMLPDWLDVSQEGDTRKGRVKLIPGTDAVPFPFESRLVVEFYTGV